MSAYHEEWVRGVNGPEEVYNIIWEKRDEDVVDKMEEWDIGGESSIHE